MSNWLNLSEGLFLFGPNSINRVEPIDSRYAASTNEYKTVLYNNTTKIATVKNSVDEIKQMLDNNIGDSNEN